MIKECINKFIIIGCNWWVSNHFAHKNWFDVFEQVSDLQHWDSLLLSTIKTNGHFTNIESTTRDFSNYNNQLDITFNKLLYEELSKLIKPTENQTYHLLSRKKYRVCDALEYDVFIKFNASFDSVDFILHNFAQILI